MEGADNVECIRYSFGERRRRRDLVEIDTYASAGTGGGISGVGKVVELWVFVAGIGEFHYPRRGSKLK